MRNSDKYIRQYFFNTLDNLVVDGVTINVYDTHSPNNDDKALIVLSSQSGREVKRQKCNKDVDTEITIDIITRFKPQFGSQLLADNIKEAVLNLTNNIVIDNFILQSVDIEFPFNDSFTTTTETIFRKLIKYNLKIS